MANIEVPVSLRPTVYGTYASLFGVKVDEAEKPLIEYPSLAAFFCRRLKKDARKIDDAAPLVSPVDGKVIYYGPVTGDSLEQVKGINYSLTHFLGDNEIKQIENKNLYHVGIYLSPGDYHGIHSPCQWTIKERNHFPGYLFPVAKVAVDNIPGLFALNERVVLAGQWRHGFFSLTPVGASNVGTIEMDFDKGLKTNNQNDKYGSPENYYFKSYSPQISQQKGEELAFFKMGSTVILIFEVPKDQKFEFDLKPGQSVILGQSIGKLEKK
ncbi:phosphatidylserine decarboxylase [Heterostelium album PN500]|uniref:phosphatidylserine decarboxylase n=1 Tax=Heterostelium pallidum (strain ATCC 26659 / Pp 5 / PN500) TaxID=670386 RepID=D3AXS4_HETP5|nr:phosphatidylserine decarboxylase [Heterostelium album PN500]EFA85751.1 phosphatidylserine decarboxylase [Heterostelium album PN500]|eukprot:XP_020437857.1 phosphatidylserine decarboxylase [Heterostelium album PN500]